MVPVSISQVLRIAIIIFYLAVITRISLYSPSLRLYLQTGEIDFKLILVTNILGFFRSTNNTTDVFSIIIWLGYNGIVTASHPFVKDDQRVVDIDGELSFFGNTTHVTTTEERTDISRIWNVGSRVVLVLVVENHRWLDVHSTAVHIIGKYISITFKNHGVELGSTFLLRIH